MACFAKVLGELVQFPGLEESPLEELGEIKNNRKLSPG